MFNSFAQLASSLEATLSLDALQTPTAETKKVDEETTSVVSKGVRNDRNEVHPNNKKGDRRSEDTEMQLVEEVSRITELLRLKDEEGLSVNMKLSEALNELQSGKLAYSDIKNELKEAKLTIKSMAEASDDKANSNSREISDLNEEITKLKKSVAEKESLISSLQTKPIVKPQADIVNDGEIQRAEDTSQLRDENAALNVEVAQNSAILQSAKEQIISFENQLDEAKAFRRQNEDQLVACQREITSLKEELSIIRSEKEKEYVLFGSKLESAESNTVEQKKQFESQIEAMKAKIAAMEIQINQQESSYAALKGASERQSSSDAEKSSEMEDLYRSLSEASESIEHEKSLSTIANAELAELRCSLTESNKQLSELRGKDEERAKQILDLERTIREKSEAIADLQAKQTTLTEKTKDIVKKYSEMKTKNQNLEQSGGEKSAEATKNLQNKVHTSAQILEGHTS
jgi:chromosome segregation ATPase